ncbi:protein O-mannosyl-transferase family [Marinicellulosiphila megalodicopiae]|uniref:protein O-mannosyl-transferase family n=1 Tax=Marinicellulosiphila megalodicopiae TaxID=2724896 RepID=UPI003BAF9CEF
MKYLNKNNFLHLMAFIIPLTVYFITCSTGIGFGDTAIIIDNIYNIRINSQVNTHALSVFFGQPFMWLPIENIAFKANLMSVVAGATSVFLLYIALYLAFKNRLIAFLVAGIFMFNKSMWWHSTVVENYAVSSMITGLALIAFVKLWQTQNSRWFQLLFFLFGIGLYNHVQFGFLGMGIGVAFLIQIRKESDPLKFFIRCSIATIIGLLPWVITLLYDYSISGDFHLTLKMALVGVFENTFFSVSFMTGLRDTGFVYLLEYPHIFLPIPFIGIYFAGKKMGWSSPSFWGVLTFLVANTLCFTYYNTWDRFAFLLQSFMVLTFFGAFAIDALFDYFDKNGKNSLKIVVSIGLTACMVWSILFYSLMTQWGKDPNSIWYKNWNNNYSINLYEHSEFTINPNKSNYREIDLFAERLFAVLPKNAIYIDDDSRTYYPIVQYFQDLLKQRQDVQVVLINSWGIDGWGNSPGDIAKTISKAYSQNQPLFMASLKSPYYLILNKLDPNIKFEKLAIAENRWIYKLVNKNSGSSFFDVNKLDNSLYIDFDSRHILKTDTIYSVIQDMESFKNKWEFQDQIFVDLVNKDNIIHFNFTSEVEQEYLITLYLTQANDFGEFQFSLNEEVILDKVNLKSSEVMPIQLKAFQPVIIKQGQNTIEVKNINASSTKFGVDGIKLIKAN